MENESKKTAINFLKFSKWYFGFSSFLLGISLISLLLYGLKPGIDFTGGALLEVELVSTQESVDENSVRETLEEVIEPASIQSTGDSFILRLPNVSQETNAVIKTRLEERFGVVNEVRFESVGPVLGRELLQKTVVAVILATVTILGYIAYRFNEVKYGVSAIMAMLHDTFIVIGVFSVLGRFFDIEIDTLFVTALLTTLSFSVHDTIVVYDRIRELLRMHNKAPYRAVVNKAILETLSRSINNSMTIIFMLLALFLLGGETIRWFVFALLIGTVIGTYSSTFTAAPLLVLLSEFKRFKR